jgi:hypothetical protein
VFSVVFPFAMLILMLCYITINTLNPAKQIACPPCWQCTIRQQACTSPVALTLLKHQCFTCNTLNVQAVRRVIPAGSV